MTIKQIRFSRNLAKQLPSKKPLEVATAVDFLSSTCLHLLEFRTITIRVNRQKAISIIRTTRILVDRTGQPESRIPISKKKFPITKNQTSCKKILLPTRKLSVFCLCRTEIVFALHILTFFFQPNLLLTSVERRRASSSHRTFKIKIPLVRKVFNSEIYFILLTKKSDHIHSYVDNCQFTISERFQPRPCVSFDDKDLPKQIEWIVESNFSEITTQFKHCLDRLPSLLKTLSQFPDLVLGKSVLLCYLLLHVMP